MGASGTSWEARVASHNRGTTHVAAAGPAWAGLGGKAHWPNPCSHPGSSPSAGSTLVVGLLNLPGLACWLHVLALIWVPASQSAQASVPYLSILPVACLWFRNKPLWS